MVGKLSIVVAAAVALAAPQATTATHTWSAKLTAADEVPKQAVKAPAAVGAFKATVKTTKTGANISWRMTFAHLTGRAVQAHIHRGKPGQSGPVVVALCAPCTSGQTGTASVAKVVVAAVENGNAYVNIHTRKNPKGEIRGQLHLR